METLKVSSTNCKNKIAITDENQRILAEMGRPNLCSDKTKLLYRDQTYLLTYADT